MNPAHVGPAKSIRNATGEGCSGSFFGVPMGEESRVLLRSALRSTASPQTALRRTLDPSPSSVFSGAEHCLPGLGGALAGRLGERFDRLSCRLPLRGTIVSLLHDGSMEPNTITAR